MAIGYRFRPRDPVKDAENFIEEAKQKKSMTFREEMQRRRAGVKPPVEEIVAVEKIPQKIPEKPVRLEGGTGKEQISIRLSTFVLDYFRKGGPLWTGRINEVLEKYVREEKS